MGVHASFKLASIMGGRAVSGGGVVVVRGARVCVVSARKCRAVD